MSRGGDDAAQGREAAAAQCDVQGTSGVGGGFCVEALEEALRSGRPEIFNTDQGVQFTSERFTSRLEAVGVSISIDGRGRALDNVFSERLWRTVKYEDIYLKDYADGAEVQEGLMEYLTFYSHERPHQALGYRTPWDLDTGARPVA